MKYMNKSLEKLHNMLVNKEVTSKELIEESLRKYVENIDVDYDKAAVDLIDFYKQRVIIL